MDTHSKNGDHSFFQHVGTLNKQLSDLHDRLRVSVPHIDRISFALYDPDSEHLKTYADSTYNAYELQHYEFPLADLPALKECSTTEKSRSIGNIPSQLKPNHPHTKWLIEQGFISSMAIPTYHDGCFIGFIFLNSKQAQYFSESLQETLEPFIDMVRFAVCSEYHLIHTILETARHTQLRSPKHLQESLEHQVRISSYAKVIATEVADIYQLDDEMIDNITQFSRYHDIGKLSLPLSMLLKTETFGANERQQLYGHIEKGIDIINHIIDDVGSPHHPCVSVLKEIVAYHHEFLDGSGYPYGLSKDDIPVSARIIAVANVFDALTSHRPYKQAWSVPFALLELEKMVVDGKLDRHCVNALRYHQDYLKQVIAAHPEMDPKDRIN
ncbi:HD domain-containing protein [Vibrio aestuarianus]|uniref:HD domain-containing phosphohydrolase n=1 Tax=Vibrio aestuarianus TaxID=28171 RepID=UPI0015586450|nr:HD domain-containing phosphohydrolase [Vibrio aestuarianus]MDE1338983.1 HD domain-containing protein [Vibrio aestuarianus]NGZ12658.1 HD domain-containing protein [Vibrio aestuarianus]NKZ48806.1 HD domain-containing protein [Vibrio aestuarianus]